MIYQTKQFNTDKAIASITSKGYKVTTAAIAAYIRHECTNYDSVSTFLSTDKAEEVIKQTYIMVTTISPMMKQVMHSWGNTKLKGLV